MLKKRFSSFLLIFALLLSSIGVFVPSVTTQAVAEDAKIVIACSDFQNPSGNNAGVTQANKLFSSIKSAGYTEIDGFLCSGDYDYEYNEGAQGLAALKGAVEKNYGTDVDMTFCQGNHDSVTPGTSGFALTGNNDTDNYGVFVLNEDDYMWHNDNETRVKETAAALKTYLDGKRRAKYTKPIFVISHLALNYSMRTYNDGDGKYAHYLFNVLNEAGANGLNIIFMFGHNHSNGWDDYLGSAAIYLEKGENILISQGNQKTYKTETLNFTYMNAGYIGYYTAVNDGVDSTLTMSVFEITDDKVIVSRYDENGLHNLKSAGVTNAYKNEAANGGYAPNKKVVESPNEIILNKNIIKPEAVPTATPKPTADPSQPVEPGYTRITSIDDIQDGDKILMIYTGETGNSIVLPQSKEVSGSSGVRVGFDLESTSISLGNSIYGEFENKEWTFTKSGDKWLIGKNGKYAKLTSTSDKGITATFENTGDAFTISGSSNLFTFATSTHVLNFNSRNLINGYHEKPASFYLYRVSDGTETDVEDEIYGDCDHPRSHVIDYVAPTATEKGYTGDEVCTNCGKVLNVGGELAPIGGPVVTVLGASLKLADENSKFGKQSMRVAVKIDNADKAKDCGIKIAVGSNIYVVATKEVGEEVDIQHVSVYSKDIENHSVVYTVVIKDIPYSAFDSDIQVNGLVWGLDDSLYTSATDYMTVNGVAESMAAAFPALNILLGSDGILYKDSGSSILSAYDLNN